MSISTMLNSRNGPSTTNSVFKSVDVKESDEEFVDEIDEDECEECEEGEDCIIKRPRCSSEDFREMLLTGFLGLEGGSRINMNHPPERSLEGRIIAELLRLNSISDMLHLIGQTNAYKLDVDRRTHSPFKKCKCKAIHEEEDTTTCSLDVKINISKRKLDNTLAPKAHPGKGCVNIEDDVLRVLFEKFDPDSFKKGRISNCRHGVILVTHGIHTAEIYDLLDDAKKGERYVLHLEVFGSKEDINYIYSNRTIFVENISEYIACCITSLQEELIPALLSVSVDERESIIQDHCVIFSK